MMGEALGLIGIALEIVGVALAALEYSGRETLTKAQRWVREHIQLRYSPTDFNQRLQKNELSLGKEAPVTDRLAFSIATSAAFAFLIAIILVGHALRIGELFAPLSLAFVWLSMLYWSILPASAWVTIGICSLAVVMLLSKKRAASRGRRALGKFAAIAFTLTVLPVAAVLGPYVLAYQWAARRAYGALHRSISGAARLWDTAEGKSGKPLLLVAAVIVVIGLCLQGAGLLFG